MRLRSWLTAQMQQLLPFDPPEDFSEKPEEHPPIQHELEPMTPEGAEPEEWFDGFYHVTTNLPAVLSWGALKSRDQLGENVPGLGGGFKNEASDMVSLTHNLGKAHQIYNAMLFAAEVAHGLIPPSQILWDVMQWMDFPDDFLEESDLFGVLRWFLTKKQIRDLDWPDMGKLLDQAQELQAPDERYKFMIDVEDAILKFEQEGNQEQPSNRVGFTAPFESFSKINPANIAILQIKVRKGADYEHVPQEMELRVDPDDIQLVKVVSSNAKTAMWIRRVCKFASADPTTMTKEEWVKLNIPDKTFDEMINDEVIYKRYLNLKREWERAMEKAIAIGRVNPEEAKRKKFYFNPGHGTLPTEPLYHVTTAKDSVISQGLKSRDELQQSSGKGLGGGESNTISFTKDIGVAKGIYSSLKEAKAFAEGKTTIIDLIKMAEAGTGAKRPWINDWMGYVSVGSGQDFEWKGQIPAGVKELLAGYETNRTGFPKSREEMAKDGWEPVPEYKWTHGTVGDQYTVFRRKLSPEKRTDELFQLFKSWSSLRDYAGGPLDPLYFNSDPVALAKAPEDQIAILEFRAKPGAYGHQVSALGEWRTYSGDAVEFVREVTP